MTIKCLIVCSAEIIGATVEKLCDTQADIEAVNAQFLVEADLIQEFLRYQPDVLIVDESIEQEIPTRLLQSLMDFPNMRVIRFNFQNNILQVYKNQEVLISQVSDILSVIRDQPITPRREGT